MILLAAYYFAGIACLMWLDSTDHLNLAGMAEAVWAAFMRRRRYVGRHWAIEVWSTSEVNVALAEARERKSREIAALREDTQSLFLPPEDKAPLCPPMYPIYDHHLGAGRYAHLRVEELDATVERDLRRLERELAGVAT